MNKNNETTYHGLVICTIFLEFVFFFLYYEPFLSVNILNAKALIVPFGILNIILAVLWFNILIRRTPIFGEKKMFEYIDVYFLICEIIILISFKTLLYIKTTTPTFLIISGICLDLILLITVISRIFFKKHEKKLV